MKVLGRMFSLLTLIPKVQRILGNTYHSLERPVEEGAWAADLSQLRHRELREVVPEVSWNIDWTPGKKKMGRLSRERRVKCWVTRQDVCTWEWE